MKTIIAIIVGAGLFLAGCKSSQATNAPSGGNTTPYSNHTGNASSTSTNQALIAFLGNDKIAFDDLKPALLEIGGAEVLMEAIIERQIGRKLAERGVKLADADLKGERAILTRALHADPNQAERLLTGLRERRGWGPTRFDAVLRRNAGLRKLISDEVQVTDGAVKLAFELQYGPRYEVRLIVVEQLTQAAELARKARAGESFSDLAARHSTDSSKAQGGLLTPLSIEDATYPIAVRQTIAKMQPGQVSDPVALEKGFALLKLEQKIEGRGVRFDDVKEELKMAVRRREERMNMQQLARQLLEEAKPMIIDPWVDAAWKRQMKAISDY